jgi:hypothetical protein
LCQRGQIRGRNHAVAVIVALPQVWCGYQMGLYKLERYSHEGYLIKVVVMALAGEVTREISPIRSWSNKNYDLKLAEKGRARELQIWEANVSDTPIDTTPLPKNIGRLSSEYVDR